MRHHWLVTFDVRGDAARRALTRQLERFGPRVAYSVFTIHVDVTRLDRLLADSAELVGLDGHLLALPYCPSCDTAESGRDLEELPNTGWVVS